VDSYFLIQNERVKTASNVLSGWGAVLLPASIARLILNDADLVGVAWFFGSLVLLFGAHVVLGLLEA
jgi:hypothetical protein